MSKPRYEEIVGLEWTNIEYKGESSDTRGSGLGHVYLGGLLRPQWARYRLQIHFVEHSECVMSVFMQKLTF